LEELQPRLPLQFIFVFKILDCNIFNVIDENCHVRGAVNTSKQEKMGEAQNEESNSILTLGGIVVGYLMYYPL
jgi:hypothetical protein